MINFSNPSQRSEIAIGIANRLNIMRLHEKHNGDISSHEIAAILNLTVQTVNKHKRAARLTNATSYTPLPADQFINNALR